MPRLKKNQSRRFILITGLCAVAVVLVAATALVLDRAESKPATEVKTSEETKVRRAIDGVLVAPASSSPRIAAVVIDNLPEAYPLLGLGGASLMYEAPVEGGGTTRLLAFFTQDAVAREIGPVRSLRPYFLDWAAELHAMPAHVGGSPEALARVGREGIKTLNQFFQSEYFWRSGDRARPHNVFTSTDLLIAGLDEHWDGGKTLMSWKYRAPGRGVKGTRARELSFADRLTRFEWGSGAYLVKTNTMVSGEVRATNVIAIETDVKVLDRIGRRSIATIGEGKAWIFTGAKKITGRWVRKNSSDRISFVDANGKAIQLASGLTWIEVLPKGTKITVE